MKPIFSEYKNLKLRIKNIARTTLTEVFGSRCPICKIQVENHQMACCDCLELHPYPKSICNQCGDILDVAVSQCMRCILRPHIFIPQTRSGFVYNQLAKQWMNRIKGNRELELLHIFNEQIIRSFETLKIPKHFQLMPIPTSTLKKLTRGFNLAHRIALVLVENLGYTLSKNVLIKESVVEQKMRNLNERFKGPHGFVPYATETSEYTVLIDDVCTTGATFYACANILSKKYGVQKNNILAWSLFRTPRV